MEHIYNTENFQLHNTAVCLGKFDGIHKGHRLLINTVKAQEGKKAVVFTFALHPSTLFSKEETKLIDTAEEKIDKLEEFGVDYLISFPFTARTAGMEPEEFVKKILVEKLDAKVIVVGKDFHFGCKRSGDVELLKALSSKYGYEVIAYDKVEQDEEVISSTRIRREILDGNMEKVTELLDKPYRITGEVIHGKQLGRTIAMPTINQGVCEHKILPPKGVYVSKVYLEDGVYGGITNIGNKPTISGQNEIGVETNIFDYSGDLYGKVVRVELLTYVRGERKFGGIEELKEQMHRDKEYGKRYLQQQRSMLS